jgi:HD-GYP domain-containing protein (c-di-GMP phosphodiesterase class II)
MMRESNPTVSTDVPSPADRAGAIASARRRLLAGGLLLAIVAVAAVFGVGGAIGSALETIAVRSGAGLDAEVRGLIGRARIWGSVAALGVVGLGLLMFLWIVSRHEREVQGLRQRLDAQAAAGDEREEDQRRAIVDGLIRLAAARDGETGNHLQRVRGYVRALAEQMRGEDPEIDDAFIETLVQTAPLHDIGKVGVPDAILLKPGPLTDEQRTEMQKHVLHGLDTLIEVKRRYDADDDYMRIACEVAFAHHERFDGTGYPFGLAADMIPLSARIVALADVYDALRNERVYKDAMDHAAAREVITTHAGTHFDPAVVAAFVAVEERFQEIAGDDGTGRVAEITVASDVDADRLAGGRAGATSAE